MVDLELSKDMTLGQVVDAVADNYFAQGADALTSQLMALYDVTSALTSFTEWSVKALSRILSGHVPSEEVSGDE